MRYRDRTGGEPETPSLSPPGSFSILKLPSPASGTPVEAVSILWVEGADVAAVYGGLRTGTKITVVRITRTSYRGTPRTRTRRVVAGEWLEGASITIIFLLFIRATVGGPNRTKRSHAPNGGRGRAAAGHTGHPRAENNTCIVVIATAGSVVNVRTVGRDSPTPRPPSISRAARSWRIRTRRTGYRCRSATAGSQGGTVRSIQTQSIRSIATASSGPPALSRIGCPRNDPGGRWRRG